MTGRSLTSANQYLGYLLSRAPSHWKLVSLITIQILLVLIIAHQLDIGITVRGWTSNTQHKNQLSLSRKMDPSGHNTDHSGHNMDHASHNLDSDSQIMDHSGHSVSGDMGHGMMMMYFHISYHSTILFKNWTTDSWQTMLGSCTAVFIMAALYEGLKVGRELLLHKYSGVTSRSKYNATDSKQPIAVRTDEDNGEPVRVRVSVGARMCSISHLVQTLLHVIQVVLSYFIMLIFMTYNFYLCLAVACGAGAGYFLFSWKRSTIIDVNEHCH